MGCEMGVVGFLLDGEMRSMFENSFNKEQRCKIMSKINNKKRKDLKKNWHQVSKVSIETREGSSEKKK